MVSYRSLLLAGITFALSICESTVGQVSQVVISKDLSFTHTPSFHTVIRKTENVKAPVLTPAKPTSEVFLKRKEEPPKANLGVLRRFARFPSKQLNQLVTAAFTAHNMTSQNVTMSDEALFAPPPEKLPRLIVYQQTHHVDEKPLSLEKLTDSGLTHIYIAALHLNGINQMTLNDHPVDDSRFDTLWEDVEKLRKSGIKIMAMLGGAAQGSYQRLSGNDAEFKAHYEVLAKTIQRHNFEGLDLDVEEQMPLSAVKRLIRQLKTDFGKNFIITLAPVYPAMLPRNRRFLYLSSRILRPEFYTPPDPLTASLCRARNLHTKKNLSGFNYIELEASPEGKMVSWYNVQMYCGWGDPTRDGAYETLIDAGWKPERIVMGVITHPNSGAGYKDSFALGPVLQKLNKKYNRNWGGLMGWELFNATTRPENAFHLTGPPWVLAMAQYLGLKEPNPFIQSQVEAWQALKSG